MISTTIRSQAEEGCLESTHRWPLSSRQPREVEISSAEMEVYWRAVLSKNARFDELFVYAVRSTGIFCRPSCPARRPRRDNVVFYRAMDMARLAGFRPCRRCHPQMYEQVLLKQHQDRELEIARDVQRAMQPVEPPRIDGWDMSAVADPYNQVGGDYYDFIRCGNDRVIVSLGDVSGKGIGAGMLTASLHAAVRILSTRGVPIGQICSELNDYVYTSTSAAMFLTLFCAALNPATGSLLFSNAGHCPAILIRPTGEIRRLSVGGIPIGMIDNASYAEGTEEMRPGDVLIVYSDGVSEMISDSGREFGVGNLIDVLRRNIACSASELRNRVGGALSKFSAARGPADDVSLMVIKRNPAAGIES